MMDVLKWRKQIHTDLREKLTLDHVGLKRYCQFYGLDSLACEVELIKLQESEKNREWVAWHFSPAQGKAQGHALVTHGLFDHTAYMRPLIESLLGRNLNVLALELPGHGLDFKDALECENFEEYTALNMKALEWVKLQDSSAVVEISHSTGAVGRLNQLLSGYECQHKVVFLNPLVKIQMFQLAKASHTLFSNFLSSVPRKKWGPGEGKDFLEFRRTDPLQPWKIPQEWLAHYFDWANSVLNEESVDLVKSVLIAQGGQDYVVSAKESKKELNSLFSNLKFSHYKNLGHQMLYGDDDEVQKLLAEINRWWSDAGPSSS